MACTPAGDDKERWSPHPATRGINYEYDCGHQRPTFECDTCHRNFGSDVAKFQHMNATNHFAYECHVCDETWPDEEERQEHEREEHLYCAGCDRYFQNDNNMNMHMRSRIHLGTDIACPFCRTRYSTATGMTHHLESGACPNAPQLGRDSIYKFIRSKDPNSLISKKLIGWHGSDTYEATNLAWNGNGYQCYLCSKVFTQLTALNQHLSSPAHQQARYHCPNRGCGKNFTTLGALVNHLESESRRYMRFQAVQKSITGLVSGKRLLL